MRIVISKEQEDQLAERITESLGFASVFGRQIRFNLDADQVNTQPERVEGKDMNVHDTRLDENGNVFTVEEMINPAYQSLTDDLFAARLAWIREARANVKLKAKLKKQKKRDKLKQNQLLAEKVAQLESLMTEMKPVPEFDWRGEFERERNLREIAEAMVRSLRSKVERLEQALKGSRQNPTLPSDVVIFYPNGTKLTFLDRARNLFARS